MAHNERCRKCKETVRAMLEKLYGSVVPNRRITLATRPGGYADTPVYPALEGIYRSLQQHRGFEKFVRADYVDADFFIPDPGFVVEFDESQHFTEPRLIALENYPAAVQVGYSISRWKKLCLDLDRHDNRPLDRDEQRAWYDTLRDFLPASKGFLPTLRLYARERVWCEFDPDNPADVARFRELLEEKRMYSTLPEPGDLTVQNQERDPAVAVSREVPGATSSPTAPQSPGKPGEHYVDISRVKRNEVPVPEALLRFEYLTNAVKLRYLEGCFARPVKRNAPFFSRSAEPIEQVRLTSSNGTPFQAYVNTPKYVGGEKGSITLGPLLSGIEPDAIPDVQELSAVDRDLYRREMQTDGWLRLFCEYMLVKTVIHELITDTEEHENDWGYRDLKVLLDAAGAGKAIGGSNLRELVTHALRLGLDLSRIAPDGDQPEGPVDHLAPLPYRAFMARREEWLGVASSALADIRSRATQEKIHTVMKWDRYSMCAFESGPVFIRKEPDWLLPRVTSALASFTGWDSGQPADQMMTGILSPYLHILIGSYWHHFKEGCDVRFFEEHRELAETIPPLRQKLDEQWAELLKGAERTAGMPLESQTARGFQNVLDNPKAQNRSPAPQALPMASLEDYIKWANEIGLSHYVKPLTDVLNQLFPEPDVPKSFVSYYAQNTLGYSKVDVFYLYRKGSNKDRVKFRVYYNVLAASLGQGTSKEDILEMLPWNVGDKARNGYVDNPAEWYFEGYFTSKQEVDHFLNAIKTRKQHV